MTFGRHWVTAAAVLPLLLGACSGDPEPKFAPPSETPTVSDTPTAEPTRQPWEKKTEAGAVAFARHWVDVFSAAINSGSSSELREINAPSCETCEAIVTRVDSIESSGGYYRSPGWEVLQVSDIGFTDGPETVLAIRVKQSKEEFRESSGAEVVRNPVSKATYSIRLQWRGGAWSMKEMSLLS